jgi:hypothetical protein
MDKKVAHNNSEHRGFLSRRALSHTHNKKGLQTSWIGPLSGAGNKQFMCFCLGSLCARVRESNMMQYPKNNTYWLFSVSVCWRAIQIFELHALYVVEEEEEDR